MGSASSKDNDANPSDLGTNASADGVNQYPLHSHPYYNQSGYPASQHGRNYDPSAPASDTKNGGDGRNSVTEDMDVDLPTESSSDLSYRSRELAATGQLDGNGEGEGQVGGEGGAEGVEDVVPMVFKWEHGGRNVYITGTFNNWSKNCPMHRSGNDFTYIANLTRGKHAYKFVVDDEWRFAPDQLTVADVEGNVNNFVDVSDFAPLSDFAGKKSKKDEDEDPENPYARYIPEIDEYTKEPPPLPPHLRHIILNKAPPSVDGRLLPVPQHVALNHLYCTAIKDGMMVLGITNRYKQKFVTTVYYSLMPGAN